MCKYLALFSALILSACASPNVGNVGFKNQTLESLGIYKACMLYGAEKLAAYEEIPQVLAQVAHGKCGKPFADYKIATRSYFQSLFPASQSESAALRADSSVLDSKQTAQDLFIVKLVEIRAVQKNL